MKNWIAILAAILLLSCPMTAFAADPDTDKQPESQSIEVYGSCQSNKNYYEITLGVAGIDTLELPDGITFSGKSDSEADNGLQIVIIPVTAAEEAEAYTWMINTALKLGEEPVTYYLAFRRGNNPAQPEGKITVTMTKKDGYEKTKLFYMDGNAQTKEAPYTEEQSKSSFKMEQTGYYILVKAKDSQQPVTPGKPNQTTKPNTPGTGDATDIWRWILPVSASMVLLMLFVERKKEKN